MGLYNPMNSEVISYSHGVIGSPLAKNAGGVGSIPAARASKPVTYRKNFNEKFT